jgi:hypothetical protein
MIDLLGEPLRFKLDATTSRIMTEVAQKHDLSVGYLRRFVDEEARLSHLGRRHGIFENLRELVRHERDRRLARTGGDTQ